ncbi:pyruvate dehydrogenase complex dihydrolipoamide acetyltransferase [Kaustia mangrovi]|uniref:Acetyltransferase component of pyruvate dehydrogenase complex n=1 Tax=Kaustia mangrovi TaxID=2593653 RepID=A0A7S8C1D7_9HYPH|nr:pyruvate dehydrogenase complex dihydrolipoamide acetyltransferase [Kaustia mangrovi]QPC41582.1 pyruvate dehydrogenase complex dihydrolipoamide acetyltransferase [Kaustia mangrovi]
MPTPILMPALSPTMEMGKLAKWLVKEGDSVAPGDVIAEIETDKATMEVEAVEEGTLGKILVDEGTDEVAVNTPIAVLLEEGEDKDALKDFDAGGPPAKPEKDEAEAKEEKEEKPAASAPEKKAEEAAPKAAPSAGGDAEGKGGRIFASPLARRMAEQAGIDLAALKGSGPHGRIVKRDIEEAREKGVPAQAAEAPAAAAAPAKAAAPMADKEILKLYEEGTYDVEPHDSMRKIIAERLTQAKQTIPHFYLTVDCELDELLALRSKLNGRAPEGEDGKPAYKLSVNDFIIKALGMSLMRVPDANVTWTEGGMLKHRRADVGVAVAIEGGLITPVVRQVEAKGLSAISSEMKDFAVRARSRKLMPHEYQGGTTAVSNLGMFGVRDFSAVINPPHATILAVGKGEKRPVVVGDEIAIKTMMTVTLSTDHRAVDGALGAKLLAAFKNCIEEPAMMLV